MSKIKWFVIVCTSTVLTTINLAQAKGWRGLVPLHSTRSEVERLLGTPKESRGVASIYDTQTERVLVFYSAGQCKEGTSNNWNVARDTLLSITVQPNAKLLVDDLKLDKTKYERVVDYHVQGVVYYFNKEEGVRISARKLGKAGEDVASITYEPTAGESYLRCKPSSAQQTGVNEKNYFIRKFDEYTDLSLKDEKARLDNFAIYLQENDPHFKGYIIVYADSRADSDVAKAHAKWAKDYLVKIRRIAARKIITIDGGCRDRLEVELYVLPMSMPPPAPNPYCKQ